MDRKLLMSSTIFLILTCFTASFRSQTTCIDYGNYTQNSTYGNNLNRVLSSLPTIINGTASGFYYTSFGQDSSDKAHALVLCEADVSFDACKNCTETAISDIRSSCPNQKQAVNWQERCMLKYSNDSLYARLQISNRYYWWNPQNTTSPDRFRQDLTNLLADLPNKTSTGGDSMKMGVGIVSGPDYQTIFAMLQCTPDLSPDNCTSCLIDARNDVPLYCDGRIGCRVLLESCFLRYEIYPFFNVTRMRELTASLSIMPDIVPTGSTGDRNTRTDRIMVVVSVTTVVMSVIFVAGFVILWRRKNRRQRVNLENSDDISTVESLQYEYSKIRDATNDFSDENKLGQGGFGVVYKGKLSNGKEIAVKRLSKNSGQGDLEFKNEVLILARLQHRNLVKLLGFALEGAEKLLVYEFVPNASLDKFIFDPVKRSSQLDWDRRRKIIGGIARGILYLHEDSRLRIIHRDLKASNVLLDSEMNPKIADFGMARLFVQDDQTQGNTSRVAGTYGYMAPEYAMHGQFSLKSDVFSFGVLLLEIVSGRRNTSFRNSDDDLQDLLSFAWKHWREGRGTNVIDPILQWGSGSIREMQRCIHIGLLCVQDKVSDRPTMASVMLMLSGLSMTLALPSEPAFFVQGNQSEIRNNNAGESDNNNNASSSSVRSNHDLSKNEVSIISSEFYPR